MPIVREEIDRRLKKLQDAIGYRFSNPSYLERAITHSSYSNETGIRKHHLFCNERLEFLGDSVLSLICSNFLYNEYQELPEGDLTRMRSTMVCETALAEYASKMSLGSFLLLGKGEKQSGGAQKSAVIADAFEATLAAIYLDAKENGIEAVSEFLLPFLREKANSLHVEASAPRDNKSRLQEFAQKENGEIEYIIVKESGPDHDKTFTAEVHLDGNCVGRGTGRSKNKAEQAAAQEALSLFQIEN